MDLVDHVGRDGELAAQGEDALRADAEQLAEEELERGAVRLAKKVGYCGVGTVEYLYNIKTGEYSFLEVNPRLQVEHPVTEQITGVNLPSVQLQLAMGIPLNKIPDIRRFFRQDDVNGVSPIDFDCTRPIDPLGHCVAGRITAEDPDSGFKPTTGMIHELHFRKPHETWFYKITGDSCLLYTSDAADE